MVAHFLLISEIVGLMYWIDSQKRSFHIEHWSDKYNGRNTDTHPNNQNWIHLHRRQCVGVGRVKMDYFYCCIHKCTNNITFYWRFSLYLRGVPCKKIFDVPIFRSDIRYAIHHRCVVHSTRAVLGYYERTSTCMGWWYWLQTHHLYFS